MWRNPCRFESGLGHHLPSPGGHRIAASAFRDSAFVIGGPIEKGLDVAAQGQAFGEVGGLFVEFAAQPIGLREVIVAQPDLDLELGILLGERPHPLFDLTAPVAIAVALFEVAQQRVDHARQNLLPLALCIIQCPFTLPSASLAHLEIDESIIYRSASQKKP